MTAQANIKCSEKRSLTRRGFLYSSSLATAASALPRSGPVAGLMETAHATGADLFRNTLNGLLAFVVPGPDGYSVVQGVRTVEQGSVDAGVAEVLVQKLDLSAPFIPQFSAAVAAILNNLAQAVDPPVAGPFAFPFANLSFPQKAAAEAGH